METVVVHYDGKVLIPEGAVDLPIGPAIKLRVVSQEQPEARDEKPERKKIRPLLKFALEVEKEADCTGDLPPDYAAQIDHYLYGTPKRP